MPLPACPLPPSSSSQSSLHPGSDGRNRQIKNRAFPQLRLHVWFLISSCTAQPAVVSLELGFPKVDCYPLGVGGESDGRIRRDRRMRACCGMARWDSWGEADVVLCPRDGQAVFIECVHEDSGSGDQGRPGRGMHQQRCCRCWG